MRRSVKTRYFDSQLLHLSTAMTVQSVIKHFLTEGDKFLVSRLSPLADQGGYAVASNYGELRSDLPGLRLICRIQVLW